MDHNQAEKTIVITGATGGIGLAAATALCQKGAYVLGTGRSKEKCSHALDMVRTKCPSAKIGFVIADLAVQSQVRELAEEIKGQLRENGREGIDVLVNNAGTFSSWYVCTDDGFELQFAVNHLAPFLLTHELFPLFRRSGDARILTVSSGSHYNTKINWKDIQLRKRYCSLRAYKQSKLCNVLFTAELNRRLSGRENIRAYAVDPGLVKTNIGLKKTNQMERMVWKLRQKQGVAPEQGAETIVFLASERISAGGLYWKDRRPKRPSRYAEREAEAARLWGLSEQMCGIDSKDYVY